MTTILVFILGIAIGLGWDTAWRRTATPPPRPPGRPTRWQQRLDELQREQNLRRQKEASETPDVDPNGRSSS